MTDQEQITLVEKAWEACQKLLPPEICASLETCEEVPGRMRKEDFDVMHFRIRPKSSRPKAFWSASGCHYQMCVGPDGSGHVCGVNFTHATRQKATGSGQYLPAVLKILKDLNPPPNTFGEPQKKGRDGSEYLVYECGYRPSIKDHLYIPIDQAAKDLAWLIESTLPKFLAIPDAC